MVQYRIKDATPPDLTKKRPGKGGEKGDGESKGKDAKKGKAGSETTQPEKAAK